MLTNLLLESLGKVKYPGQFEIIGGQVRLFDQFKVMELKDGMMSVKKTRLQ